MRWREMLSDGEGMIGLLFSPLNDRGTNYRLSPEVHPSGFVAGRAAGFDDAGAGRLRDLNLLDFREAERMAALVVDLGLVMGSSEVHAAPSVAPPQPRLGKSPGRAGP